MKEEKKNDIISFVGIANFSNFQLAALIGRAIVKFEKFPF